MATRPTMYSPMISAAVGGCDDTTALLTEGWMRQDHPTLDGLSPREFRDAAMAGLRLAREYPSQSAALARSYGLLR